MKQQEGGWAPGLFLRLPGNLTAAAEVSLSLPGVSRVVSGRGGGDTARQRPRPPVSSVHRSLQDTTHTSLVSGARVLSSQSKRVGQAEGGWPHLVSQLPLESMQPSESVLKLAAILLAGQTTHPAP